MYKILSIDLDALWEGTDSIYIDPDKKLDKGMLELIRSLSQCNREILEVGIDHHQICLLLDQYSGSYEIDHVDAHHDLYAENHFSWLNPLFIRGKRVTIGNFLFQLLREGSLTSIQWLLPSGVDQDSHYASIRQTIGVYYSQKVKLKNALNYVFPMYYDLIYISLSPEWIPIKDLLVLKEILEWFKLPKDEIEANLHAIQKRWSCNDNPFLTSEDRFYFKKNYK